MTSVDDGRWQLQKKQAIIKKPPYLLFTENNMPMGGVGIQKYNYEKVTKHHSIRT